MTTLATETPPYADYNDLEIGRHPLPAGFKVTDEFMREVQELNQDKKIECWKNEELVVSEAPGEVQRAIAAALLRQTKTWIEQQRGRAADGISGFQASDEPREEP